MGGDESLNGGECRQKQHLNEALSCMVSLLLRIA